MQFNSTIFPLFFAAVYAVYLLLGARRFRAQNAWLLAASYVFYGYWDPRFLALLALSTAVDFVIGRRLEATEDQRARKRLVTLSVLVNLGVLGFFKYFGFFVDSTAALLETMGLPANVKTLEILLPVGISFYTFQTLSYTIDVYRRAMPATRDLLGFALFVSFFPQLVAGPIERASRLLPQIEAPRSVTATKVQAGLWLLVWGYFKKTVIADQAATIANPMFGGDWSTLTGLEPFTAVLAFTIHIYCDFSGYSDIARGLAKLMGFDFLLNFRLPYLATGPSDFWLRWHVSLSTWLRDYLYIPLGGNRGGTLVTYRNMFLVMALGGLWHGAAWPYVLWGSYHGVLLVLERLWLDARGLPTRRAFSLPGEWARIVMFWGPMLMGMAIVRCSSLEQFWHLLTHQSFELTPRAAAGLRHLALFTWPLVIVQLLQHTTRDLMVPLRLPLPGRIALLSALVLGMMVFGVRSPVEFFYFQF
ncbi:MAG: MBOAT family O-acyltransferase [Planctomycetota bacterium]|nr:MBOAT family O-acyltransferase [Planctomycetota bacterium]